MSSNDSKLSTSDSADTPARKGPLSFLSGALTAGLLAWLALGFSRRMVVYFAMHPPHYSSPIAQNIAVTLKTLLVGLSFLATFSTGFVALGLTLVFLRSLFTGQDSDSA